MKYEDLVFNLPFDEFIKLSKMVINYQKSGCTRSKAEGKAVHDYMQAKDIKARGKLNGRT